MIYKILIKPLKNITKRLSSLALLISSLIFLLCPVESRAYTVMFNGGAGMSFTNHHDTILYQFKPKSVNVTGLLGLGLFTEIKNYSQIGLSTRYIYNYIQGKVDPNIGEDINYRNNIHNILTTIEVNINFADIGLVNSNSINRTNRYSPRYGIHGGVGINNYLMDLYAKISGGGIETKIDPVHHWRSTAAGFIGLYLINKGNMVDIMVALDYFYLGKVQSQTKSRSSTFNNLKESASFHNHNLILTVSYLF